MARFELLDLQAQYDEWVADQLDLVRAGQLSMALILPLDKWREERWDALREAADLRMLGGGTDILLRDGRRAILTADVFDGD